MDKNKNRTDLLAAGRKKLQQFRQKKDGKGSGSRGKSTKNSGKAEKQDADAETASTMARSTMPEDKSLTDVSVPHSVVNAAAHDVDASDLSLGSTSHEPGENLPTHNAELATLELGVVEHDVDSSFKDEGESIQNLYAQVGSIASEGEGADSGMSVSNYLTAQPVSISSSEEVTVACDLSPGNAEENSPPSPDIIPDTSLMYSKDNQVTDVGAMQEADGLGREQSDCNSELNLEGVEKILPTELGQTAEFSEIASGVSNVEPFPKHEQTGEMNEVVHPTSANMTYGFSANSLASPEVDISFVSHAVAHEQSDEGMMNLIYEEKPDTSFISGDIGEGRNDGVQEDTGCGTISENSQQNIFNAHGKPLETNSKSSGGGWTAAPVADLGSVSLSQLSDIIRGLSEDNYRTLLKAREQKPNTVLGVGNLVSSDFDFPDLLERLKEELFLTNLMKDIFQLQLAQQSELQYEFDRRGHELVDEMSLLRASVSEVLENNSSLTEELKKCRSDLQTVATEKDELQNQIHGSKLEVEELSSKMNELQNSLESSEGDLLSLSTQLAEYKNLVGALQVENETLNANITSVSEQRKNLLEEKDFQLQENEKLLSELSECKSLIEALHFESSNLTEALSSVTEEKKQLVEEEENLCGKNEKLLAELAEYKDMISALQVENSSLKENFTLVTEEREKVEEDKNCSALENKRLSSELLVLQERLSSEHGARLMVEVDLKEVTMRLEQLMEENNYLTSSLDIYKAKTMVAENSRIEAPAKTWEDRSLPEILEVQSRGHENAVAGRDFSGGPQHPLFLEEEIFDDSFGFLGLEGHWKEAEKTLQQLERAIEELRSRSVSFSRSGGKMPAPGVSKLIQTFEPKLHADEQETEERALTGPFVSMKELTGNLRALLKQLILDATNASRTASVTCRELTDRYNVLSQHSNNLEEANIELGVLYEAIMQHGDNIEAMNRELMVSCEAAKQEVSVFEAENTALCKKLHAHESIISELQSQLNVLQHGTEEMESKICKNLDDLQKEVTERVSALERDWYSTVARIIELVRKLDKSLGNFSLTNEGPCYDLDVINLVALSVNATTKMIEDMQNKLEAAQTNYGNVCNSYNEMKESHEDLLQKHQMAVGILQNVYGKVRNLLIRLNGPMDDTELSQVSENLLDPLDHYNYETIIIRLESLLGERLEHDSFNQKLNLKLMNLTGELEDLKKGCLDSDSMCKLIEDIEGFLNPVHIEGNVDKLPASRFGSLLSILLQKYKEANTQLGLCGKEYESNKLKLTELQNDVQQLTALCLQHENEVFLLKESLSRAEERLVAAHSEIKMKESEVQQSEQRFSSTREKLSIAVAKGKGLIVQRDNLKQSLSETSSELERCLQELQVKDSRIHEVETKLKAYSEAGERVEALESELSYIRNSATALRESFLLKDSVLQRIEEILEDLDLPEHFHSRDIIEKIDWLAKSSTGNPLAHNNWDQKSCAEGGSYSDAGLVMEPWKDDSQPSPNSVEDLKRKYDELQSKFYGLAEHNEMLEQSLMERNDVVQRWEDLLDRIDMPLHLQSVEPEGRIEWLGRALSESHRETVSLQQKITNFENYCGSLTADLEGSQRRISDLEADLQAINHERENLSDRLETLKYDYEKLSARTTQFENENEKLQNEVTSLRDHVAEMLVNEKQFVNIHGGIRRLQSLVADAFPDPELQDLGFASNSIELMEAFLKKLLESHAHFEVENKKLQNEVISLQENVAEMLVNEKRFGNIESEVRRLQSLVSDVLQDPETVDMTFSGSSIECFEVLLRKLLENYASFNSAKPALFDAVDTKLSAARSTNELDTKESDVSVMKEELEEALRQLSLVKQERDGYTVKQQTLASEIEALCTRREELQLLLNQEEQKSASLREKLNVAVRKGKLLVQHRDSLKQNNEESNAEVERLKSVINIRQNELAESEQKLNDLSSYPKRLEALESEILFLRNCLTETEHRLQETGHTLSMILNNLGEIDVGGGGSTDPVEKLEQIAQLCHDMRANLASSEQDSRKSKRAAELLLAELNEVQERNDILQEELAKTAGELAEVTKERDLAEAAKVEAFRRLETLHDVYSVEQNNQVHQLMGMKSAVNQFQEGFRDINNSLVVIFSKELEFLRKFESGLDICLKACDAADPFGLPLIGTPVDFLSSKSDSQDNLPSKDSWSDFNFHDNPDENPIGDICGYIGNQLQELMIQVDVLKGTLQKHSGLLHDQASSLSTLMGSVHREITSQKEKDKELVLLHKSISLLIEACSNSFMEIENRKAELLGNNSAGEDLKMDAILATFPVGHSFSWPAHVLSEDSVRTMADKLLVAVRDFSSMKAKSEEGSQKEMKTMIMDLQKELQEKEIQKEKNCMQLVNQIKDAEAAAARYSLDFQSARSRMHDLEKQVKSMEGEKRLLEQKLKELPDAHAISMELEERVKSLTGVLTAKDQEIESLMQALDEEEVQMEDLSKKIEELVKVVQQKNLDLENLETSRGKVMKKLSITVSKFDELHQLCASLLAEVEKHQSQLQDRDAEISFLRQEVTRCTNDALVASQITNTKITDEIQDFLMWFDTIINKVGLPNSHHDIKNNVQIEEHKKTVKGTIQSIISELQGLREAAQSKDALLQIERSKLEELTRKEEFLEKSLHDKESRLNLLDGLETSETAPSMTSEILEVEPVINKWTVPGTSVASQVRSLRKGNSDQVAIAIDDMDPESSSRLEDEDDDKVHGFKSLTTSRIVPRFTRPVSDLIDGLWVSCDRTLMRQPALRLGIMIYWVIVHALLATFAV